MTELFTEARAGSYRAWVELVDLGRHDLAQWLTRRHHPKLGAGEIEEISEIALSAAGLRFGSITSWPHAWAYSKVVAVSLLRDRHGGRPMYPLVELVDPSSQRFQDRTDLLDLLAGAADRLSRRDKDVLLALVRAVLEGETSRGAAAELGMSLRSFERTKHRVVAFCTGWFATQAMGAGVA